MSRLFCFSVVLSSLVFNFSSVVQVDQLPDSYNRNVKVKIGVNDYGIDNLAAAADIKSNYNSKSASNNYDPDTLAAEADLRSRRKISNGNEEVKKNPEQENITPKANEVRNTTTIIKEIIREVPKETNKQSLQKGNIEEHLNYAEDAKNVFSNIKSSIFTDFPNIHDVSHSSKNDSFNKNSFTETYKENQGDAQEAHRKLISKICDPKEGGNIHVLAAALNSICGVNENGEPHSNEYMNKQLDLSTSFTESSSLKKAKESMKTIFDDHENVTPKAMLEKVESLQAEILEKSAEKIDVTLLQEHLDAIYTVLANDFDKYNKDCNGSGIGWNNKDNNMFLDLDKMNEYFEEEDKHLEEVRNSYDLKDQDKASLDKVITHILDHIGDLPSDTGEYLNNEDSRDAYRKSTEQFISEAAKNPSQEMVNFLLNSISTNKSGTFSSESHNEKILKEKIEINVVMNNGKVEKQKVSIEDAKKILENMPNSSAKNEYARQIIEGIGGYCKNNSNLGTFSNSEYGVHIVLDRNNFAEEHYSEHEVIQTNAIKAAMYNSSKNTAVQKEEYVEN